MIDVSAIGSWARLWGRSVTWFVVFFYWLIVLAVSGYSYSVMQDPGGGLIVNLLGVVQVLIWSAALLYLARESGDRPAAPLWDKFAACAVAVGLGNIVPYMLLPFLPAAAWEVVLPYFNLVLGMVSIAIAVALFPLEVRMVAAAKGDREARFGQISRFLLEQRRALYFTYAALFFCIVASQHLIGMAIGGEVTRFEFGVQQAVVALRSIGAILFMIVAYDAVKTAAPDLAKVFD